MKRPAYTTRVAPSPVGHAQTFTAVRIALAYPERTPTPTQLQDRFGMSRATAYRWVRAFKAAKGESHEQ